ncbi:hypothetical protein DRJ22_02005 [Candidatus Woesearchaeota archaeon]|nr:MAG: hypothetical protein B6U93_01120 [Candidatus Woesearchaeota archaeon ex4484_78]RLE46425.1 MAG: hypothetical protein DRJ22_02005 [Candidatus Woesearchaeota archaeon]
MFKSKRAISPLIATILLVAVSVGLGALVMSWGEEYIAQRAEFVHTPQERQMIGCERVQLSIIKINNILQVCKSLEKNAIEVWLDNGPDVELYNIHARIAGTAGVDVREEILEAPLARENAVKVSIPYDINKVGEVLQVKLTPKIYVGNKVISCPDNAVRVERIPDC